MVLLLWLAADVTVFFWMSFPFPLCEIYRKYWLVFASDDAVWWYESTGE